MDRYIKKCFVLLLILNVVSISYASSEKSDKTNMENEKKIYTETEKDPIKGATTVEETVGSVGNMALKPVGLLKDTANHFVNPRAELVFDESDQLLTEYPDGPKFRVRF